MNKKVKNFPVASPSIGPQEIEHVLDAVKSGWVSSLGPYIKKFEEAFAKFIGVKYALATTNGTSALHLALLCCGVKRGDEVIVPDLSFIATANAVSYTGAKPVFADIDPETWCIDPQSIRRVISVRTKAVIPVHLYGHPADMDSVARIGREYNVRIIEDAAEAHGAKYKGKKVGGIGNAGIFSFFGNKIITTGEGGMITTHDKMIYEKARFLRDQAMSRTKRYWHTAIGFNYRMTNMQAALGVAQLKRIREFIGKKREIFEWYKKYLSDTAGLQLNPEKPWAKSVFWMTCLLLENSVRVSRDQLIGRLQKRGIDARPFLYPISQMPMYRARQHNPIAERIASRGINLPSSVTLCKSDVKWIAVKIKGLLSRRS